MLKEITPDQVAGRTVKYFRLSFCPEIAIITFTDDTYILLEPFIDEDGDCGIGTTTIKKLFDNCEPLSGLLEASILTEEEVTLIHQQRMEANRLMRRERELAELDRLKKKYEEAR